jgi:hypothetical protein
LLSITPDPASLCLWKAELRSDIMTEILCPITIIQWPIIDIDSKDVQLIEFFVVMK